MNKQVDALIMGQSYTLAVPDSEVEQLRQAVARVDGAMCKIRDAGKIKARERIAVLAALNVAFDFGQYERQQMQGTNLHGLADSEGAATQMGSDIRLTSLLDKLDQILVQDGHLL